MHPYDGHAGGSREAVVAFSVTSFALFALYAATSAPGLGLVDSGELSAAAAHLNIAHPSGYPIYVLLGRIWILLLGLNPARAMVLFSCAAAAAAAGVLAATAYLLLRTGTSISRSLATASGIALSGAFGLSQTVWTSVSFAEVYPLTLLFASLLIWIGVRVINSLQGSHMDARWLILASYLWGLAFGNHLTIFWFAPWIVLAIWPLLRNARSAWQIVLACGIAFSFGCSSNLFLPIRSSLSPTFDWGNPETISGFVRHLTGWQYHVWMFSGGVAGLIGKFGAYIADVPRDLGWGLSILAMIGMVQGLIRIRRVTIALLVVWLLGVCYNLNYEIPDIAPYFLAFYCPVFLIAVQGAIFLLTVAQRLMLATSLRNAAYGIIVLLPLTQAIAAIPPAVNQSTNRFAEHYVRSILATVPDSALIIQANWDIQSPFEFLQQVEEFRPDVVMLDINLMQRSWYIEQETRRQPDMFRNCSAQVATFRRQVALFEAGRDYDARRLEAAFVELHDCVIATNLAARPVYLRDTYAIGHPGIGARFEKVPGAFFWRLGSRSHSEPVFPVDSLQISGRTFSDRERHLLLDIARSVELQGRFALQAADSQTARKCLTTMRRLPHHDDRARALIADLSAALAAEVAQP